MFTRILAPVSLKENHHSAGIISTGVLLTRLSGAELHFLTVHIDEKLNSHDQLIAEMEAQFNDIAGKNALLMKPFYHVREGRPGDQILAALKELECDLVIMSRHHSPSHMLGNHSLGTITARVASQAPCAVHIVKPPVS